MASSGDRFRRLRSVPSPAGRPADLFEHFGIHVEPEFQQTPAAVLEAGPCHRCGWYLPLAFGDDPCPICAQAHPLAPVTVTTP